LITAFAKSICGWRKIFFAGGRTNGAKRVVLKNPKGISSFSPVLVRQNLRRVINFTPTGFHPGFASTNFCGTG
jgi:hypothetical protein